MNLYANTAEPKQPTSKLAIKIVRERVVRPIAMGLPSKNGLFKALQQPEKQLAKVREDALLVFMHEKAHQQMWAHAKKDAKNEVGGALLGMYAKDEATGKEFIVITDVFNQPLEYSTDPTEIRFTVAFYNELSKYLDQVKTMNPHIRRLGLYHTHPGYGIFMSRTDKKVFQGSFKEKWQIALIADPITEEDGIFIWHNKQISDKVGYQTYQTDDLRYQLHYAQTDNLLIANYNGHIQLKNQTIPLGAPPNAAMNSHKLQGEKGVQQREQLSIKSLDAIKINAVRAEREQLKVTSLDYLPKPYPLVGFHYKCTEVKLTKYKQPMRTHTQLSTYPLEIFIQQSVNRCLQTIAMRQAESIVLLQGQAYFDKHTNKHFVEITNVLPSSKPITQMPFHYLADLLQEEKAKGRRDMIGWCYIKDGFPSTLYPFFDTHRNLFERNAHIGFLVSPNQQGALNWQGATLIAQDYQEKQPYEYFEHLFLYEKRGGGVKN